MEKILVVEDSPEVLSNLTDLLSLNGYTVLTAENGSLGYNYAKDFLPDLIISDIMMPELDGYSFLKLVRNDQLINGTPFIFLTAKASYDNLRDGMGLGADDYIAKPYSVKDVILSVKNALEKKKRLDRKLDSLRNNIAMSIPHELRTPLTAILGYTEFLTEEAQLCDAGKAMAGMLQTIRSSALRLNDVINKFITYSDTAVLAKDPTKLFKIRNRILPSVSEIIISSAHNLSLKYSRKDDIQLNVEDTKLLFDETLFSFLVNEVMENAFKYSTKGTKILVDASTQDAKYIISVRDFGVGIKRQYMTEFSALTQFEREKYEIGGSGLGIATMLNILEIYGGQLRLESNENEYTLAEISIPMRKENNDQLQIFN